MGKLQNGDGARGGGEVVVVIGNRLPNSRRYLSKLRRDSVGGFSIGPPANRTTGIT